MNPGGWLLAIIMLAMAGGIALYFRRSSIAREKARLEAYAAMPTKKYWGKQLSVPTDGPSCSAAKELADQRFKFDEAPCLPLAECTCKFACRCSYRLLEDRRSGKERREGYDRRDAVRYDPDNPPRRKGHDRRKDRDSPFKDYVI